MCIPCHSIPSIGSNFCLAFVLFEVFRICFCACGQFHKSNEANNLWVPIVWFSLISLTIQLKSICHTPLCYVYTMHTMNLTWASQKINSRKQQKCYTENQFNSSNWLEVRYCDKKNYISDCILMITQTY